MKNGNIIITPNTDAVDIDQKSLGLDATRETFPPDVSEHIHRERGLHIQIRHNQDKQTFAQANELSHLIAAAPEMLEALKSAVNYLDGFKGPMNHELLNLKAVIAKAEGRP